MVTSLIVHSRSSFCLFNKNSLNCTSGLVLLCFFISFYFLITFFVLLKFVAHNTAVSIFLFRLAAGDFSTISSFC